MPDDEHALGIGFVPDDKWATRQQDRGSCNVVAARAVLVDHQNIGVVLEHELAQNGSVVVEGQAHGVLHYLDFFHSPIKHPLAVDVVYPQPVSNHAAIDVGPNHSRPEPLTAFNLHGAVKPVLHLQGLVDDLFQVVHHKLSVG